MEGEVFKRTVVLFFCPPVLGKHGLLCHYVYCTAAALVESMKILKTFWANLLQSEASEKVILQNREWKALYDMGIGGEPLLSMLMHLRMYC